MGVRDLKVTLIGSDQTGSAFGSAGKSADGFGKRIGSLGKGLALAFGGAAVAGIAGVGLALVQGVKDAASYQQITDQVAATIKATGAAAGVSVAGLKEYAGQLESQSGVDEELILSGQNVLLTFTKVRNEAGKGNDVFNQASQAALDLSTTMGGDLAGANVLLGKALNDPIKGMGALSKAGVALSKEQKDQIKTMVASGDTMGAQKIILGELTTQFGGAAAAAGAGLTGSLARAKDSFSDVFREVGGRLIPVLADASEWAAVKIPVAFAKVESFIKANVIPAFERLSDFWTKNGPSILATVKGVAETIVGSFKTAGEAVVGVVRFFREHDAAAKTLGVVVGVVAAGVAAAWVAQAAVSAANAVRSVVAWMSVATASTTSATIQSKSTAQIVVGWIANAGAAVASGATTVAIWGLYASSAVAGAAAHVVSAGRVVAGWVVMAASATASAAVVAVAWVVALGPIGLVIAGVAALVAALVVAYKNSETFRDIVDGAFKKVGEAGRWLWEQALKPAFAFIVGAWMAVAGAIVNGAADAFGWMPGIGPKLRAAADKFNDFKETVNAALRSTDDSKTITVRTPGAEAAITALARLRWAQDQIDPSITIGVMRKQAAMPGFAGGVRNFSGGMAVVGEEGPEIVNLPRGADVFTNRESRAMTTTADRPNRTYMVNVTGTLDPSLSEESIVNALRRMELLAG